MKDKFERFLALTDKIATYSKDPSTKVGMLFLNKDETSPMGFGYNGMPRGLDDTHPERNERPEKYLWYEHAERNGIYNIAREMLEGHIMFSTSFPNMEGARAIVSSGLAKLVVREVNKDEFTEDELANYEKVKTLLSETKVELVELDQEEIDAGFYWEGFSETKLIEDEKKIFKRKKKYLDQLTFLEAYADSFSPYAKNKAASMVLNYNTFAPIENAFGVYSPPEVLKEITKEMIDSQEDWFLESEKNAIFNAVKEKFEGKTAVVAWCPCIRCSLSLVAVAISKVVTRKFDFTKEADLRWKESFEKSHRLFEKANVSLVLYDTVPAPIVEEVKEKKNTFKF